MYKYIIFIHSATAFTSISLFTIRSLILFYIKENKYRKISYAIDSCLAISGTNERDVMPGCVLISNK